jgi:hypothetical protein
MQLPKLPLTQWELTKHTLHLMLQIVGKLQLQYTPKQNHWWHITLYISPVGISSQPICYGDNQQLEIVFNLKMHRAELYTSDKLYQEIPLADTSVAEFYQQLMSALRKLGLKPTLLAKPYDIPGITAPFAELTDYRTYQPEYVEKFHEVLLFTDRVFKKFKGRSYAKTCPVQLYWHHLDLTLTRFSGQVAPKMPAETSQVEQEAYSHEVISFGFWAGDDKVREAAYYNYTYPLPEGIDKQSLKPKEASWVESNGSPMAYLSYDAVRTATNPEEALLSFLESSYQAGAKLAGWPVEEMRNEWAG